MRTRLRRALAAGGAVVALTAGVSIAGAPSAQAANCCSFQGATETDAMQQMYSFEAANDSTCAYLHTTMWEDDLFGRSYVVSADCNWP